MTHHNPIFKQTHFECSVCGSLWRLDTTFEMMDYIPCIPKTEGFLEQGTLTNNAAPNGSITLPTHEAEELFPGIGDNPDGNGWTYFDNRTPEEKGDALLEAWRKAKGDAP